jgi:hypothetical protein
MRLGILLHAGAAPIAGAMALLVASGPAVATETQGYVISWFATATYNLDFKGNCPEDRNGGQIAHRLRVLKSLGYTEEQANAIVQDEEHPLAAEARRKAETRAMVNGKPASIYNYPEAVVDPNLELSSGKYAYGFDLDGRTNPGDFEDPDTRVKVDNQLWRAVGCTESFTATPPDKPYYEDLTWALMIDSAPGWALQITGEDLARDGKVTVTLDKVTQHLHRSAAGGILHNMTYVIDPGTRSHNEFKGEIKDGVLWIEKGGDLYLEGEMPYHHEIALHNTHMRIHRKADQELVGYWSGYLDWKKWVYMYTARPVNGEDTVGIYHALKKSADADPDPKTGQNRLISATWRMEAVPAYLADINGKIVAAPSSTGLSGVPQKLATSSAQGER